MSNSSTQPKIRLYGLVSYDRGAKARWLLTELGLEFEDRWLDREQKEHEGPAFLKLNPMGRVPVLQIGDQTMFESGAICAYLADRYLDRGLAPAIDSPERAAYQQWLYFADSTLASCQTRIMIIEDIPTGALRAEKEAALLGDFRDVINTLDGALSKGPYLVNSRLTAADICVGYHLYWCLLWPEFEAIVRDFPRVSTYLDRLKKLPSANKAKAFSYEG